MRGYLGGCSDARLASRILCECCWEWNDIGVLFRERRKRDALCLLFAVFVAQVAVNAHGQCTAIFLSEPTRDSWNIHAGFDAACCKQMPQIVVRNAIRADLLTCTIERLLA